VNVFFRSEIPFPAEIPDNKGSTFNGKFCAFRDNRKAPSDDIVRMAAPAGTNCTAYESKEGIVGGELLEQS
jgi:hypothetical protein